MKQDDLSQETAMPPVTPTEPPDLLTGILNRVSDGFVALDADWRYTYVNPQAARMLNREKPEDLIGKHIWTEYPEGVGQPFYQAYYRAMETQQAIMLEEYYEPWNRWFENRIYPSPDGLTIFFTEITERKQLERSLEHSLELSQMIYTASTALSQSLELDTVLDTLLDHVGRLVAYDSANIMLVDGENHVSVKAARGYANWTNAEATLAIRFDIEENPFIKKVVRSRSPVLIRDSREMEGWQRPAGAEHVIGWLGMPLISGDRVIGLFSVDSNQSDAFTEEHVYICEALGPIGANAIENALFHAERLHEEERLQQLIANMPIMMTASDTDGTILVWNRECERVTGYRAEEVIGNPHIREKFYPDPAYRQEVMRQLLDGEKHYRDRERLFATKDGSTRVISLSNISDQFPIAGWNSWAIGIDVTQRKQMEDALRESEEKYRTLIEQASDGIFVADQHGYYRDVNSRGCAMLGYSREELLNLHLRDLIDPDNLAEQPLQLDTMRQDEPLLIERILKHADGRLIPVEISARLLPDGSLLEIVRDITERKQALVHANALLAVHNTAERLQQLRTLSELAQEIISVMEATLYYEYSAVLLIEPETNLLLPFALSEQGKGAEFVSQDKAYIQSFDIHVGQGIVGKVAQTGISIRVDDVTQNPDYVAVREGIRSELCVPMRRGEEVIGVVNIESTYPALYSDQDQQVLETIAAQIAVAIQNAQLLEEVQRYTDELEERVAERTEQLEAKNRELEAFTYSVSHDLKAPLRGIDGYSRLILEDHAQALNEEGQLFLRQVRSAAAQMHQLIDDLLAYSRLEWRAQRTGEVNLRQLVRSLIHERSAEIEQRSVDMTLTVPDVTITADPDGLTMALRNLLDNALKFTQQREQPMIEVGGEETDDAHIIWVRDNGIGFDMKYHDRIMEMFQRLHRIEDYPGTGIGLAIVQKAIQRMKGRVRAESTPGQGATFYMEIPK